MCKEYRKQLSSRDLAPTSKQKTVEAESNVGGSVTTHLAARPLRYRYDLERDGPATQREEQRKIPPGEERRAGPFWQNVEDGDFNMHQAWQAPVSKAPVSIRLAALGQLVAHK